MAYTISVDRLAAKFIRSLSDAVLMRRIRSAIDLLAENPRHAGAVKLPGEDNLYRVRVGDYRIIYRIQDAQLIVLVVQIGPRREVCR